MKARSKPVLFGLFAVAFISPLIIGLYFLRAHSQHNSSEDPDFFADAIQLAYKGAHLLIESSEDLNPRLDKGYLIVGWFKLRKFPQEGEKVFLLSKYEPQAKAVNGLVVALTTKGSKLHPTVYWRDREGKGNWYLFSEVEVNPNNWFMLGVSFYDQHILGVLSAVRNGTSSPDLNPAGGVDLEQPIVPENHAPLIIGAEKETTMRGKIGPLCVLVTDDLPDKLRQYLKRFRDDPREFMQDLSSDQQYFCTLDWKEDKSKLKHNIRYFPGAGSDAEE